MRLVLAIVVATAVGGCVVRPAGTGLVGGPVYAAPAEYQGWAVTPPMEVRTPSAPRPSFAPPPIVQCYRLLGGTVTCQ